MKNVRDCFLTEQMGECWHRWVPYAARGSMFASYVGGYTGQLWKCSGCSEIVSQKLLNRSFSNEKDCNDLKEWAKRQSWWSHFIKNHECLPVRENIIEQSPDQFANALALFLLSRRLKEIKETIEKRKQLYGPDFYIQLSEDKEVLRSLFEHLKDEMN